MGISNKMGELAHKVQTGAQSTSLRIFTGLLKALTGIFIGFTLGLIGQEILDYGYFSVTFVCIMFTLLFVRLTRSWGLPHILIFDLITFLVALLLKMYIQLAP